MIKCVCCDNSIKITFDRKKRKTKCNVCFTIFISSDSWEKYSVLIYKCHQYILFQKMPPRQNSISHAFLSHLQFTFHLQLGFTFVRSFLKNLTWMHTNICLLPLATSTGKLYESNTDIRWEGIKTTKFGWQNEFSTLWFMPGLLF